jgi:hypothetical protein
LIFVTAHLWVQRYFYNVGQVIKEIVDERAFRRLSNSQKATGEKSKGPKNNLEWLPLAVKGGSAGKHA